MLNKQVSFYIYLISCIFIISCAPQKDIISVNSNKKFKINVKKVLLKMLPKTI